MEDYGMRVTVDQFCKALVEQLLAFHTTQLRFDSPDINRAFREILEILDEEARKAVSTGDDSIGRELLELLNRLSPDPGTGSFDGFWAALRELQPAYAEVRNPLYRALELKGSSTTARQLPDMTPEWQSIVSRSAAKLGQLAA